MKLITYILIIGFVANVAPVDAQQRFQSSISYLDKYRTNPAYGGMDNLLSLAGSYRSQWQNLEGQPEFINLSANLPLFSVNGATGVLLRKEDIGVESDISALFSYNQVFGFDFGLISVGARAGILRKRIDGSDLFSASGSYEDGIIDHNDAAIPNASVSGFAPTWGAGLYFFSERFDFGIVFDESPVIAIKLDGTSIEKKHLISVHGDYFLHLSDLIHLEFFGLVRSDWIQWQAEAGLMARYEDRYFAALQIRGYNERSFDAISVGLGGRLNKDLQIAYSYDITLSPLRHVSNGAHELILRYRIDVGLGKKLPQKILHSPRLYD